MGAQVNFSHVAQSDQCPLYNEIFSRLYLPNEIFDSKTSRGLRPYLQRELTSWPGPSTWATTDHLDHAWKGIPSNRYDLEEEACRVEETSAEETHGEQGMCHATKKDDLA